MLFASVMQLADLIDDLYAYWSTIKCPSTNALPNWKNSWKTSGVCSGLSEHDYFKTALELRKKLNLLSIFKKNGMRLFLNYNKKNLERYEGRKGINLVKNKSLMTKKQRYLQL